MDKGFLLGIYGVISGWMLILLSLVVIKVLITLFGTKGLLVALIEVVIGFFALSAALYLWYRILRWIFLSLKSTESCGGPGGT